MTEELKQAAQAALEALDEIHAGIRHHQLALAVANNLRRALTQRPAAQGLPELVQWHKEQAHGWRHAAMTSAADKVEPCRSSLLRMADFHESAAQAIASLPTPQQATPEPVGEVFQFHPMPEGWPARFRCDSCDGNGEIGELVSSGHFQPPERQTCTDCGGRGWTSEEHAFNADHMREFAEAHALLTRPAPGVPEGWRDAFDLAAQMLTWGRDEGLTPEQVNEVDAHAKLMFAMLAAAQAKGDDK